MTEINSDDSLYKFITTKRIKSPPCAEGSTRKPRKCTAAYARTNKNDQCAGVNDRPAATAPVAATSVYCSDVVQKTCRPAPQHDKGLACINTAAGCRGQCTRTGKYRASDNPQCTGTRSSGANDGQCTENYGANNNRCAGTGNYWAEDDGQCTGARKHGTSDNPQCTGARSYRANDGQRTGTRDYRVNDGQCTGTAAVKYGTNKSGCNGCGCISAAAAAAVAAAAAACLGGANAFDRDRADTLQVSSVYRWARVAADWTWDKTYYFLVAAVSFFLGMYTAYWCLCICEDAP